MQPRRKTSQPSFIEQLSSLGSPSTFSRPIAWQHTFYLGPIEEPGQYSEWFEIIRTASENDEILININSPGGVYSTALQFRRAIMESAANVTCSIEGECHSAASIIFLSADGFSVSEGSNMLIHDYSGIVGGKGSEMIRQIQHEKVSIDGFLATAYEHFLTEAEIANVLSGQDMWLDGELIMERTKSMVDARQAEYEAHVQAAQKAAEEPAKPTRTRKQA